MMGCHLDSESRNLFIGPCRGTGLCSREPLEGGGGEKEEKGREEGQGESSTK